MADPEIGPRRVEWSVMVPYFWNEKYAILRPPNFSRNKNLSQSHQPQANLSAFLKHTLNETNLSKISQTQNSKFMSWLLSWGIFCSRICLLPLNKTTFSWCLWLPNIVKFRPSGCYQTQLSTMMWSTNASQSDAGYTLSELQQTSWTLE